MSQIVEPHKEEDLVEVQHLVKYFPVRAGLMPVSYTHLTLPTSDLV